MRTNGHVTIRDQIIAKDTSSFIHSFIQHTFLQHLVCVERCAGPRGNHGSHGPDLPGLTVQLGRQIHSQSDNPE